MGQKTDPTQLHIPTIFVLNLLLLTNLLHETKTNHNMFDIFVVAQQKPT